MVIALCLTIIICNIQTAYIIRSIESWRVAGIDDRELNDYKLHKIIGIKKGSEY